MVTSPPPGAAPSTPAWHALSAAAAARLLATDSSGGLTAAEAEQLQALAPTATAVAPVAPSSTVHRIATLLRGRLAGGCAALAGRGMGRASEPPANR